MSKPRLNPVEKDPALLEAEAEGCAVLRKYLKAEMGRQAALARVTGICPPSLTNMSKGGQIIGLDHAVVLEVATAGELRAEVLCPSRAKMLADFLALRAGEQVAA